MTFTSLRPTTVLPLQLNFGFHLIIYIRNQERIIAISKTSCVSALNYHHENNYLFS